MMLPPPCFAVGDDVPEVNKPGEFASNISRWPKTSDVFSSCLITFIYMFGGSHISFVEFIMCFHLFISVSNS